MRASPNASALSQDHNGRNWRFIVVVWILSRRQPLCGMGIDFLRLKWGIRPGDGKPMYVMCFAEAKQKDRRQHGGGWQLVHRRPKLQTARPDASAKDEHAEQQQEYQHVCRKTRLEDENFQ